MTKNQKNHRKITPHPRHYPKRVQRVPLLVKKQIDDLPVDVIRRIDSKFVKTVIEVFLHYIVRIFLSEVMREVYVQRSHPVLNLFGVSGLLKAKNSKKWLLWECDLNQGFWFLGRSWLSLSSYLLLFIRFFSQFWVLENALKRFFLLVMSFKFFSILSFFFIP